MNVTVNLADLSKLVMWSTQLAAQLRKTGRKYDECKADAIESVVGRIAEEHDDIDD